MHAWAARTQDFAQHYRMALQAFTRLPVSGGTDDAGPPAAGTRTLLLLPGVGLLVGMTACLVFAVTSLALLNRPWSPLAAAVACLIATALLTGAWQEAGLAHWAERLGAGADSRRLQGPDAPLSAFGSLALLFSVTARISLLALLAHDAPGAVVTALLAGHVVSRTWPLLLWLRLPWAGAAASDHETPPPERSALVAAAAWTVLPLGLMALADGLWFVLLAVAASGLAWLAVQRQLLRNAQPFDRSSLGAAQQLCETAFYLGAAIGLGR